MLSLYLLGNTGIFLLSICPEISQYYYSKNAKTLLNKARLESNRLVHKFVN